MRSMISLCLLYLRSYDIIIYRNEVVTMAESKLAVASMDFAVKILNCVIVSKGIILLLINLRGHLQVSVPIFVRQIMLIVNLILFQNYKYHSKSVMKQNIGLNLC